MVVAPGSWWPDAPLAEVAGPPLASQHRRGRVPSGRCGVAGHLQRGGKGLAPRRERRPGRRRPARARRTWSCPRARPCRGRPHRRARPAARSRRRSAETVSASPIEAPIRMNRVPNNGPLAPPTVETRVIPTLVRSAPAVGWGSASIALTAAFMPRSMFDPWSASPIAASSSVRWSRFSATSRANLRTHCSRTAVDTLSDIAQMPHLNAGVLTGASQRERSSSSTLSSVIDEPAMSSEVM